MIRAAILLLIATTAAVAETSTPLYLRPVTSAQIGTSYFGQGYPRGPQTPVYVYPQRSEESGIGRANAYLHASGWYARERERRAEIDALMRRIAELERRIADLEKEKRGSE